MKMPYSYHTFIYPFYWKEKDVNLENHCAHNSKWDRSAFDEETACVNGRKGEMDSKELYNEVLDYATYQYFMPKARKMIFDTDNNSISCYRYKPQCIMKLRLDTGYDDKKEQKWYYLPINNIRLEFLDELNIGVLIFEAENYGLTSDKEVSGYSYICGLAKRISENNEDDLQIKDELFNKNQNERLLEITRINDLGRRVYSPYLKRNDANGEDEVSYEKAGEAPEFIKLDCMCEGSEQPIDLVDCLSIKDNITGKGIKTRQNPDTIENLIFDEDTNDTEHHRIDLYPAIDDRMFVVCCMGAKDLPALQKPDYIYNYRFRQVGDEKSKKAAALLYQLVFLERKGNLSCHDDQMLQQKLNEHIYTRWGDWGTIHGVTEYSLVCITGCDENGRLLDDNVRATVINPFLTEYTEMAKIALLQRAEIINLEDEVSDVSEKINPVKIDDSPVDVENMKKNIANIQNTWRKYIMFQNELLLPEVTFQEQGVEIYDMLKTSFRIEKLSNYLDSDLNNLHNMAEFEDDAIKRDNDRKEAESDNRLSRAVNLFSVVGISLAIAAAIQDALGYAGITTGSNVPIRQGLWKIFVLIIEFVGLYFLNRSVLMDIEKKDASADYKGVNWTLWLGTGIIIITAMLISLI